MIYPLGYILKIGCVTKTDIPDRLYDIPPGIFLKQTELTIIFFLIQICHASCNTRGLRGQGVVPEFTSK